MVRGTAFSGAIDAMLKTLTERAGLRTAAHMFDSTLVRAHHCAAGLKIGFSKRRGFGRSRDGQTDKTSTAEETPPTHRL